MPTILSRYQGVNKYWDKLPEVQAINKIQWTGQNVGQWHALFQQRELPDKK